MLRSLGRYVSRTIVAATLASLVVALPAQADSDRYFNNLSFQPTPCNPSQAVLSVATGSVFPSPSFVNGVAWLDYYGLPIAVSPPFRTEPGAIPRGRGVVWPWPSPPAIPPGRYTLHALLLGESVFGPVLTTVSATTTVGPSVNPDCTPAVAAATTFGVTATEPLPPVPGGVRPAPRDFGSWSSRSLGPRARYPKARICGSTVCVKRRAGAAWTPVTAR
ncbi:hypothetical protein LRS13_10400 [Svornostia abyssi]|uniref:Uncharacterized protein n=1 Tax=Svornostia abyssi TaxID=2898438 RepID=A0ABY5PNC2_9ACTN|nr:hypothetical protein LRS13_10400 [Parviterribacteraceae bacterium J379]